MGKKTKQARKRLDAGEFKTPSPQDVKDGMTSAGAWTARQLAEWGVPWPPKKGWRNDLRVQWELRQSLETPMADAMNDLIARLESATGPDRDLDAMIARDIMGIEIPHWPERCTGQDGLDLRVTPYYTSSLTDAMTLVTPEHGVTLHRYLDMSGRGWASVFTSYPSGTTYPPGSVERPAATCSASSLALALCAAALKIRNPAVGETK